MTFPVPEPGGTAPELAPERLAETFRALADSCGDLLAALDREYRFLAFNRAYADEFARIFGVTPSPGMSIRDALAHLPEECAAAEASWARALGGEEFTALESFGDAMHARNVYEVVYRALRDGEGSVSGALTVIRNVTAQRAAERERDLVFALTHDLLCVAGFDGFFKRLNPAWERALGFSIAALLSQPFMELVHPDDHAATRAEFERLAAGQPTTSFANRIRHSDGSYRWLSWTATPVPAEGLLYCSARDETERNAGERALRESQTLLAGVLDSSLDGIAALKPVRGSDGRIVDFTWLLVNARAEALLGRSAAELVGRGLMETLPGNRDLGLFDSYVRVVETGVPAEHEFRYEADAISGWFQNIAAPFGDGFTVTFRDVTRQKEANETRLALAAAQMGTWEVDLATRQVTGSRGTFELFGFAHDERRDLDAFLDRIDPADRAGVAAVLDMAARQSQPIVVEFRVRPPDGPLRWLISRGAVHGADGGSSRLVGVLTDTTERKQSEDRALRLLAATSALAGALTAHDVVEVVLQQGMQPLGATAAAVTLVSADGATLDVAGQRGYPPAIVAAIDRLPMTTLSPLTDTARDGAARFLSSAEIVACYPVLAPFQALVGGSVACLPLGVGERALGVVVLSFREDRAFSAGERTFLGSLAGLCAQALDRAALYEQERASRAAAEEALRLRDQFLTAAAHELRTPLTVLLGSAGLLARRAERAGEADGRGAQAARAVAAQVTRLDRLINLMLEVTTLQAGRLALDRAPLNLVPLVARVIVTLSPALYGYPLDLDCDDQVWVLADATWIERVVQELLDNAARYSPSGSPIRVAVRAEGDSGVIAVRDHGIGIPPAAIPLLFERFYRAPNVDASRGMSGLGLGLSVAQAVVEDHGGRIEVRSDEGRGSTVEVRLPLLRRDDQER
jgi:PAS domain S-box-containing protein